MSINFKKLWVKYNPILTVVHKCVRSATEMREKPGVVDWVNLGFALKENLEDVFKKNPWTYFDDWEFIATYESRFIVHDLLVGRGEQVVFVEDGSSCYVVEVEGIEFGWISNGKELERVYVEKGKVAEGIEIIRKIFWEKFGNAVVGLKEGGGMYVESDSGFEGLVSGRSREMAEELGKYMNEGIYRSVMFYGRPGSGKSVLIRSICLQMGLRTIRFKNLSRIWSGGTIPDLIRMCKPDAIIFEDIDKVGVMDVSELLEKIENLNKNQKLTFATSNEVSRLDEALVRPGRFDLTISIKNLEEDTVREMVGGDEEIFSKVKEYPAAYIMEVMKRVKIGGKKVLENLEDLEERLANMEGCNYEMKREDSEVLTRYVS